MRNEKKTRAIKLRKEGKSYREIMAYIPVAKSTLSEWFKSVELAVPQKQRITKLRRDAALRGAHAQRNKRLAEVEDLKINGKKEIDQVSERELWLIGIALYWAEGSKQNSRSPSTGIMFGNSDFRMLVLFLRWLKQLGIYEKDLRFELYVHRNRESDIPQFRRWWANALSIPTKTIDRIYLKKGNPTTNRTNIGDLYHGLLRIKVNSSTSFNRRVDGWIEGIVASLGSSVIGNTSAFGAEDSRIVPWLPSRIK